jgi:translation initiation factor 2 beta subunit (eIF-2beta)/eIF-5
MFPYSLAISKFFAAELGCACEKKSVLKGQHSYESLLKHLDRFIEKFLLCQKCKLPETTMFFQKKAL